MFRHAVDELQHDDAAMQIRSGIVDLLEESSLAAQLGVSEPASIVLVRKAGASRNSGGCALLAPAADAPASR